MEYTGKHYVGEIAKIRHGEMIHEVIVTGVWECEGNGVTIEPTGNYGFPIDLYDDQFDKQITEGE